MIQDPSPKDSAGGRAGGVPGRRAAGGHGDAAAADAGGGCQRARPGPHRAVGIIPNPKDTAQEAYLDAVQPVATATLRQLTLEADASARGLDPTVRKALRRRARLASRRRQSAEGERGTIFTVRVLGGHGFLRIE